MPNLDLFVRTTDACTDCLHYNPYLLAGIAPEPTVNPPTHRPGGPTQPHLESNCLPLITGPSLSAGAESYARRSQIGGGRRYESPCGVAWDGRLGNLCGQSLCLVFELKNAKLYSFWIK